MQCKHCYRDIRTAPTNETLWVHSRDLKKGCMRKPGKPFTHAEPDVEEDAQNAS